MLLCVVVSMIYWGQRKWKTQKQQERRNKQCLKWYSEQYLLLQRSAHWSFARSYKDNSEQTTQTISSKGGLINDLDHSWRRDRMRSYYRNIGSVPDLRRLNNINIDRKEKKRNVYSTLCCWNSRLSNIHRYGNRMVRREKNKGQVIERRMAQY